MQKIVSKIFFYTAHFFLFTHTVPIVVKHKPVIALFDTPITDEAKITVSNFGALINDSKCFNMNEFCTKKSNLAPGFKSVNDGVITEGLKKRVSWLTSKKRFSSSLLYAYHGQISQQIIRHIAPQAIILEFPILNAHGSASKQTLYDGLLKARAENVDIVYLGLQVFDWDVDGKIEKKIMQIIKSFSYVVAPSGNCGHTIDHLGFPAAVAGVISVGGFVVEKLRYPRCTFCQANSATPADFIMLGENIEVQIWDDLNCDVVDARVSGTSFAAASMTGLLAQVIIKNNDYLSSKEIKKLIQYCSCFKDISWRGSIRYGTPDLVEILFHLNALKSLKKKNIDHYFRKLRNCMSR